MSLDRLQISISDISYQKSLQEIDVLDNLNSALDNVIGLNKGEVLISSDFNNLQLTCSNPIYSKANYLTRDNAVILRNSIITQLATITELKSYKDVLICCSRNDLQNSDGYLTLDCSDGLEISITGCKFQSVNYIEPVNIDILLSRVNDVLDSISGLEFSGIIAFNTHAFSNNLVIKIDNVTYNGNKYLSLINATNLRNYILDVMASVNELDDTDMDVEIKISRNDFQESD